MEARGAAQVRQCGALGSAVAAVLVASWLALCAPATAGAATLTITTGADPVESIITQVGASGSLDTADQRLTVKVKPAGASSCGANPNADDGSQAIDTFPGVGPYAETSNWLFQSAGSYLLCAWITDSTHYPEPVVVSAAQTVAVRIPHLSLSLTAPGTVLRGRTFQVAATAQTEAERDVRVLLLPDTGRGCPANSDAAYGTSGEQELLNTSVLGGPTTQTENVTRSQTGRYLVCGYVNHTGQVAPEATAVATIEVVPPCIVPHLRPGTTLRRARARIVAGHCTVGKVRYVHSVTRARGTVVALSPRPGSGHATHAPVSVTVSSGAPKHRHHRR